MSAQKSFKRLSMRRMVVVSPLISCLVPWVSGCGGSAAVSTDVRKPAAERPDVDGAAVAAGSLSIPAKAAFNLTSVKSAQSGSARGSAELVAGNGARCQAESRDGGDAWGEFQLGYCFDQAAVQPLQAIVKLRLKVLASVSSTASESAAAPSSKEPAQAAGTLVFCIKDTNGIVLKKEQLYSGDLEKGAGATNTIYERVFDVRFEPERGYYLFAAGRADTKTADAQSAACVLDVSDYSLEIDWQPAKPGGAPASPAIPGPAEPPPAS